MFRTLVYSAVLVLGLAHGVTSDKTDCLEKDFGFDSFVCVCTTTQCHEFPDVNHVAPNTAAVITSDKMKDRFAQSSVKITKQPSTNDGGTIVVNKSITYQSIIGFGGAITDAATRNILSVSKAVQDKLLQSYFSKQGIEYTLGRVPIASTDFSTHEYSYDEIPDDFDMRHFALVSEDLHYKIPVLKRAMNMSSRAIKLFSSPWSSPPWMKTSASVKGRGFLKGNPGGPYYKAWAKYLVKFLDAYKTNGINFWGITAQNEPTDGRIPAFPFQCLGFTADMQRDFIVSDLGPALRDGGYKDVKLMILDDDILLLPDWAKTIYGNSTASDYVSGLGVHWYLNGYLPYSRMTDTHNVNPSKFILATEACAGSGPFDKKVTLGSWGRAEQYTEDILQDLENWVEGWTDWNIALNMSGGPNWVNNNVDSPIIVNAVNNEFYKQPMYYALGHFSKFLTPGSVRLDMKITNSTVTGVVFSTPENFYVMILYNKGAGSELVTIRQDDRSISVLVKARSINTVVWNV